MMRERDVETYLIQRVRSLCGKAIKLAPTEAGIPDRLVMLDGMLRLVEVKTDAGRLSKVQWLWHNRVREKQGIYVHVVFGKDGVDRFIEEITK